MSFSVQVDSYRAKRSVKTLQKILGKLDDKEANLEGHLAKKFEKKRSHIEAKIAKKEAKKDKTSKKVYVAPEEYRTVCTETTEERCVDTPRKVCDQVTKCTKTPRKTCGLTPQRKCAKFPTKKCQKVPKEACVDVPKKSCEQVPSEKCLPYPEKSCEKITVKRPREVCYPNKKY